MKSLEYAYDIIRTLRLSGVGSIYEDGSDFVIPHKDGTNLVRVSESSVIINVQSLNDRLTPSKLSKLNTKVSTEDFEAFITELSSLCKIELNHFGVSYYCSNIEDEVKKIKELVGGDELYEEDSGIASTKWLFIGNADDPSKPLFELVLNERSKPVLSSWVPHFQIDIDTSLSSEDLSKLINKHLGEDWIKWSIKIDGLGTPLVMGRLCSIDGLKVYLGIGTNKRSREWHRKEGLRAIPE
ncbi:MAG: hypothetical protein QG623_59 [Patescibacteria group bacterium]|nr:hypothetical protein [Patescibacteria group bacterium]